MQLRRRITWTLLIAAAATAAGAGEPLDEAIRDEWRWAHFNAEQGLPPGRVTGVVEATDGTTWAGTDAGPAYFDGYHWVAVELGPDGGTRAIVSMEPLQNGELLVVADSGEIFRGGRRGFERVEVREGGREVAVREAVPLPWGEILVAVTAPPGRNLDLIRIDATGVRRVTGPAVRPDVSARSLFRLRNGPVLVAGDGGLYRVERDRFALEIRVPGWFAPSHVVELPGGDRIIAVVHPEAMRGLWRAGPGDELRRIPGFEREFFQSVTASVNGDVVVATQGGYLCQLSGGRWRRADSLPPGVGDIVSVSYRNRDDLWIASVGRLSLLRTGWSFWSSVRHGPIDARDRVHEILVTRDGAMWLATGYGVVVRERDGRERWIRDVPDRELGIVTALAEDGDGAIWIGSGLSFEGAYRWDGRHWRHFGTREGLDAERVHKIRVDRRGRPWFLGINRAPFERDRAGPGAFVLDGGRFRRMGMAEGLPSGRVYDFAEGPDGSLWFATFDGLTRCDGNGCIVWSEAQGLRGHRIFALWVDRTGRVWFSHEFKSIGTLDDGTPRYFDERDGLVPGEVRAITEDDAGLIWAAATGGILCFRQGAWVRFDTARGLANRWIWPIVAHEGRVYVGTLGAGVAILDPAAGSGRPPRITVAKPYVEAGRTHVRWSADAWWGEIDPKAVETRSRVDEGPWTVWGTLREVDVVAPKPGPHRVEIEARGLFGETATAEIRFDVPAPLWRSPGFLAPVVVLSIALAALAFAYVARRRRAEADLRRSEEQIRQLQKLEAVGRLAGGVAHDFNNFLTAILGFADVVEESLRPGDPARDGIEKIKKASQRASALVRQLLAFGTRQVLQPRIIDLNKTLAEIGEILLRLVGDRIALELRPAAQPATVRADPSQIEQVLFNLVVNARDAMPTGGCLMVELDHVVLDEGACRGRTGLTPGPHVRIEVVDSGTGMDEATRARVFEPFFSTKEGDRGTGLGLATVYGIVRQSRGHVEVESRLGHGSTFRVLLPAARDAEPVEGEASVASAQGGGETVLVVEDRPEVREVVVHGLRARGYTVIAAASGSEGLRAAEAQPGAIDLVLADVVMPGMSGPEMARRLTVAHPETRVLFMSGFNQGEMLRNGVAFVAKPFSIEGLARVVREVLDADGPHARRGDRRRERDEGAV